MANVMDEYFQGAELAVAAYANNLLMGMNITDYVIALKNAGMSEVQAEQFAATYEIVEQIPNTLLGFSATVFSRDGGYILAIRGTENVFLPSGMIDWASNIGDIGANGIAISQALDLFNYIQDSTAHAGDTVYHYSYIPVLNQIISSSSTASATGALYGQAFTVSGHSLGGQLALIMG